jgi:hypothetical protein
MPPRNDRRKRNCVIAFTADVRNARQIAAVEHDAEMGCSI